MRKALSKNLLPCLVSVCVCSLTIAAPKPRVKQKTHPSLPQVEVINQQVKLTWKDYNLEPSADATEFEFCRRVFLDLIGRIPTIEELREFRVDKSDEKKAKLVQKLIYSEKYQSEYIKHWSTIWTNVLIGRSGGTQRNDRMSRPGMQHYLKNVIAENRSYDQMVRELVAASGTSVPGEKNFNGAVNFLAGKLSEKASQATAATSRIFLGLQVQCTQCHNHPFNEWKQNQYWEMNSFFRQTVALRRFQAGTNDVRMIELTDQDFAGEDSPHNAQAGRIYYEQRNGKLQVATPVFVDGTAINPSGYLDESHRRQQLADLIVQSELLPKALVNRMWAHFFGYGFTKPIDDMGPHNMSSHPELLDYLAAEFKKNSFDVKQLIRWIVLSDAYGLSSKMTKKNASDDPLLGESPKFSHFYLRQMTAEQLYDSLLVATQADKTNAEEKDQRASREKWLSQFVTAFGTDEGDETTTFDGTIPQTLMLFNGEMIKKATSDKPGSFLYQVAMDPKLSNVKRINQLYLAALARYPTKMEKNIANQLLVARRGDVTGALQDIWWALLNSNEFILNH